MADINRNLRFLRIVILILGFVMMLAQIWYWVFPETFHFIGTPNSAVEENGGVQSLSATEWWGGFIITFLPRFALFYALYQLYRLSLRLSAGHWFDQLCEKYCTRLAKGLSVFVVLNFIYSTLLIGLLSLDNPPGQRLLAIKVGSDDAMALIVALFAVVISHMVRLARLQREELNEII